MKTYNGGLATVLRADDLPKHAELPEGWRRTMGKVIQYGGPWACYDCGAPSLLDYRCSICGQDLTPPG